VGASVCVGGGGGGHLTTEARRAKGSIQMMCFTYWSYKLRQTSISANRQRGDNSFKPWSLAFDFLKWTFLERGN